MAATMICTKETRASAKWPTGRSMTRKMPIGIQDFETIRTGNYVYVDKTAYIYKLANEGKPYFLGRPRRFGKSLFISTLKYYFLGRKDLFSAGDDYEPLAIAALENDWITYPVFHIDLNVGNYKDVSGLKNSLDKILFDLEDKWGKDAREQSPSARFSGVIHRAAEKSSKKVAVLIDEYDKPLLQSLEDDRLNEEILVELKAFYSVLKSSDQYLQFLFLTGITKFSKTSVFSDLNQPRDITLVDEYSGICGITEKELKNSFEPELRNLGLENDMSLEKTIERMQKYFNGYHFSEKSEGIFNPFSVLNTLANKKFAYYWFATGTPTFLTSELKKANFHAIDFKNVIVITPKSIDDYRPGGGGNIASLLYQTGYLTIKAIDKDTGFYNLGFPNEEVEFGFLEQLLPILHMADKRAVIKIGVVFDPGKRNITEWKVLDENE
jgi:hypothetical protein